MQLEHKLMENKRSSSCQSRTPASSTLAMQKNSHAISKPRQNIRIVHIFAPEIIKTDTTNFREVVQRLTGKPEKKKKAIKAIRSQHEGEVRMKKKKKGDEDHEMCCDGCFVGDVDGFLQGFTDD